MTVPTGTFRVATTVRSGLGALSAVPEELDRAGAHRVALVADAGVAAAGVLDVAIARLPADRIGTTVLVRVDPDVSAVEEAAEQARAAGCDAVLAVGGGSALGAAKAVAIRLTNRGPVSRYEGVAVTPSPPAPTVAVPTTAGSGSEVSQVLVLHEPLRPNELIIRVAGAEPCAAILDATVLRGLPAEPMRDAGLDALSHALEAQWTRQPTWFATALGHAAARAVIDLLPDAVDGARDGRNRDGRHDELLQHLLDASCAANMACGNSGLGLVHALSGAPAVRLPHGRQNGILLPGVARFNDGAIDERTRSLAAELPRLYGRLDFDPTFPPGTDATAMVAASRGHVLRAANRRMAHDEELLDLVLAAGAEVVPPSVTADA